MPYSSVAKLPPRIKKYPAKIQRMWMKVFNVTYTKVLKDGGNIKDADAQAFTMANGIVKKNIEKFGVRRYGQSANMQYLIDTFLGRNR